MKIISNAQFTEIQVDTVGGVITEAFPTYHHTFAKRKILTHDDSIENYKEVSPSEKTALEAKDAKFVEPTQDFVDMVESAGAVYNRQTGYFELNGLIDITLEQMLTILRESSGTNFLSSYSYARGKSRTFFPIESNRGSFSSSATYAFVFCSNLEVIDFGNSPYVIVEDSTFYRCDKLRIIQNGSLVPTSKALSALPLLEDVSFRVRVSFSIAQSPYLSLKSVRSIPEKAENLAPVTVTVHPEVFAKLADENNTEWHNVLTESAEKNISFITVN